MNINSDIAYFENLDIEDKRNFPIFLKRLEFSPFRHIKKLDIIFNHPISVISGTNRSGKSTILMALACSHTDFQKRNPKNGKLERHTWGAIMKFTSHDEQKEDWTYYITYKKGEKPERKRGQRKKTTKKWNGIGKKESQFKNRQVIFIDLDRIVPARFFGDKILNLTNDTLISEVSSENISTIESYLSYILEERTVISRIAQHLDKEVYRYNNQNKYTSFNAASGEDVLTRIIIDTVEAPKKSLILIDEIEMGLHPKVQRRLMDVIRNISRNEEKQFILTTHSPTILDSLSDKSRIFIEKNHNGEYRGIQNISVSAALTKMDSKSYPLVDLYCEDDEAKRIIEKGISAVERKNNLNNFSSLINIIVSGSASLTYTYFKSHKDTYDSKKIKVGFGCILDGDMKLVKNSKGQFSYPAEEHLHFLYSNECPEKFLTRAYLNKHPNVNIEYYLENENPHYLFKAIIDNSEFNTKDEVFEYCWTLITDSEKGKIYIKTLEDFLIKLVKYYSHDL